ncbi:MAG: 2-oxoacid:ferredoxin oxidoreductase subunit beta [Desulfobacterota bacterium]|nr:2-oxoacid:ferredoxin oxidoreductase subunit beta [Thermodesulfobacteriota bacterium]
MPDIKDYESLVEIKWCPGCGNFSILAAMKKALCNLGLAPHEVLIISGIGQAAKTPHYLACNLFHGLHGRALPIATGAKIANHNLTIIVNSGDGDCYGEGGNHFINAIRRNIDLTLLVHNNKVYGLTKGQASPTSDLNMVTRAQPHGVMLEPFNPLAVALALGCGFVARGYAGKPDHLASLIEHGVRHRGFSLIDILQPCVSFNHINTYPWYNERVYELERSGHDPSDFNAAWEQARKWGERIPIGLFYREDKPTLTDRLHALRHGPLVDQQYVPERLASLFSSL